ncbi:hypothetical protein GYB57_04095 [bacterium]|nr:hypothetical protein [bacterium]
MKPIFITLTLLFCIHISVSGQDRKVIGTINDLSLITENDKLGIIDNHNAYVVKPDNYTKIEYDKEFDLYRCFKANGFEICFDNGQKVESDYLFTDILDFDGNGTYRVKGEKGFGYISDLTVLIPPIYDDITVEAESYFGCCMNYIVEKDKKKGLYIEGKAVLECEYDDFIKDKTYPHFIVVKDNMKGMVYPLLSDEGKIVEFLSPTYKAIELQKIQDDGNCLYLVSQEDKVGLFAVNTDSYSIEEIKSSAYFVLPPQNKKIQWSQMQLVDDVFSVPLKKQGHLIFIANQPTTYYISEKVIFNADHFPVAIKGAKGQFQFIADFNKLLLNEVLYDEIVPLPEDIYAIEKENKWGAMFGNTLIIPLKYNTLEELKIAYENGEY